MVGYETTEPPAPKPVLKRKAKDSVFTDLFGVGRYLIRLYRALHPEDTDTTEQDIADVTIRNVFTNAPYNDLGFRVGNRLLVLVEAQSTWSANIVIRILIYLVQTYTRYFSDTDIDLYSEGKIRIPEPELYVIYTGDRKHVPGVITLQEEYFQGRNTALDVRVKIISDSNSDDIISQYIVFSHILTDQVKLYGRTRKAITETIRICKDQNILKDYLEAKEKEVIDIMVIRYEDTEEIEAHYWNMVIRRETKKAAEKAAKEAAAEAEIKATIETYKRLGKTIPEAMQDIISLFNLSAATAEEKAKLYWV